MGWAEKAFDAFRDVLRLQDKVQSLSTRVEAQQSKIESLNLDVAQLKMAVTILLGQSGVRMPPKPPFEPPSLPGR